MATKNFAAQITIGGALAGSFRSAMSGAEREVVKLGSSIKALNQAQASVAKGRGLFDVQGLLKAKGTLRDAEKELAALREQAAKAGTPTAALAARLGQAEAKAAQAREKFDQLRDSQYRLREELRKNGIDTRKTAGSYEALGKASEVARAKADQLRASQEQAARRLAEVEGRNKRMAESVGKVGEAYRALAGNIRTAAYVAGAVAAAGGSLFAVAKQFSDSADEIDATAMSLGITVEKLQEFRYAAELSGGSASEMDDALRKLSGRMAQAGDDGGELGQTLREFGLDIQELRAIGPAAAMEEIADAMQRAKDPAQRVRLAMAALGRTGIQMIPILAEGSDGLRKMGDRARETGGIMDRTMIEAGKGLNDAWFEVRQAFAGVVNLVSTQMAPIFTQFFGELRQMIIDNRGAIKEWADRFGAWLRNDGPKIIEAVRQVGSALIDMASAANTVAQAIGGWGTVLKLVAIGLAAAATINVIRFGLAIFRATAAVWAVVSASTAWATVMGALRAATLATSLAMSTTLWPAVMAVGSAIATGTVAVVGAAAAVGGALASALVTATTAAWGFVAAILANPLTWFVAGVVAAVAAVGYLVYKVWECRDAIMEGLGAAVDWVTEKIDVAITFWTDKFQAFGDWLGGFWDATVGKVKGAWDSLTGAWDSVAESLGFGDDEARPTAGPVAAGALAASMALPGAAIAEPVPSVSIPPPARSAAAPQVSQANTINIQAAPGQDPRAIAIQVDRILREREGAAARGALHD